MLCSKDKKKMDMRASIRARCRPSIRAHHLRLSELAIAHPSEPSITHSYCDLISLINCETRFRSPMSRPDFAHHCRDSFANQFRDSISLIGPQCLSSITTRATQPDLSAGMLFRTITFRCTDNRALRCGLAGHRQQSAILVFSRQVFQ
jgi:hypothetical protein